MNSNLIGDSLEFLSRNKKEDKITFEGMIIFTAWKYPEVDYKIVDDNDNEYIDSLEIYRSTPLDEQKEKISFIVFPGEYNQDEIKYMFFRFSMVVNGLMKSTSNVTSNVYVAYFYDQGVIAKKFLIDAIHDEQKEKQEIVNNAFEMYDTMSRISMNVPPKHQMKGIGFYVYY